MNQVTSEVASHREKVNIALRTNGLPLLGIRGPCAPNIDNIQIHLVEGRALSRLPIYIDGLVEVDREPIWKPRSDPLDWHGMIESHPDPARAFIEHKSQNNANVGLEFGNKEQVEKFSHLLSLAWIGARNEFNTDLQDYAATFDPGLPLAQKNGLSGEIDQALLNVQRMRELRGNIGGEIILIYRGGENAKTPKAWENTYKDALDRTEGRLVVDIAHGGEMAHDPSGNFTKTVIGQLACLKHVLVLAEQGFVPAGVMMESSDAKSPTDPVIPFKEGINGIVGLKNVIKANQH